MRRLRKYLNVLLTSSILATNVLLESRCFASEIKNDAEADYINDINEYRKQYGETATKTSNAKVEYAIFLKNRARDAEAERIIRPALAALEKSCGPESLDVANAQDHLGRILRHQHRLAEAEFYQRKALALGEKLLPPNHAEIANYLMDLAKVLTDLPNKVTEAKAIYLRALDIAKKSGDARTINSVSENLATCLLVLNESKEARQLWLSVLQITADNADVRPDIYASTLSNIGQTYVQEKQYDEAKHYVEQALRVLENGESSYRQKNAFVLELLGEIDAMQGHYGQASQRFEKSAKISKPNVTDPFIRSAESQRFKFVDLYGKLLNISKLPSLQTGKAGPTLKVNETPKTEQKVSLSTLSSVILEYSTLKELKDTDLNVVPKLESIYRRRIVELGPDSPLTCEAALQIAVALRHLGCSQTRQIVEPVAPKINTFATKLLNPTSSYPVDLQKTIKLLGGKELALYFAVEELIWLSYLHGQFGQGRLANGNLTLAEKCLNALLSIQRPNQLTVDASKQVAEKLLTLASAWRALANIQESARLTENALAIAAKLNDNTLRYNALLQLASLELAEADLEAASEHIDTAKLIALKTFGAYAHEVIPCYRASAQISMALGAYDDAKNYALTALKCKDVGQADTRFLHNISGLADLCSGRYESAKAQLKQSLESSERDTINQEEQGLSSAAAAALAEALVKLGDTKSALQQLDWALNIDQKNGTFEGLTAAARDCAGLARVEALEGDKDLASRYALQAAEYTDQFVRLGITQLSFAQQCSFVNVTRQIKSLLLDTCSDSKSLPKAYGYIIDWEGLLLSTLRSQSTVSAALTDAADETKKTVAELTRVREKLGELESMNGPKENELASLTEKKERLERELAHCTRTQFLQDVLKDHDAEWFQKQLQPNHAFLNILTYKSSKGNSEHYALIALKSGEQREPHFFDLGTKDEIDSQIALWRNNITQQFPSRNRDQKRDLHLDDSNKESAALSSEKYLNLTQSLAKLFINNDEISKFLGKDINKIWLCPDSEIARMPWNSLCTICGINNITICEIDSPRELVQMSLAKQAPANKSAHLLLTGVGEFYSDFFNDLPGTRREIRGIKEEADKASFSNEILLDAQANKSNVRNKFSSATIAHFSTHGFARGDKNSDSSIEKNTNLEFGLLSFSAAIARNPLTDSGLVLSPVQLSNQSQSMANTDSKLIATRDAYASNSLIPDAKTHLAYALKLRSAGNSNLVSSSSSSTTRKAMANLLTAEEIVGMNLQNCKLVTLSACKTGLGTGLNGQGVIGLRSAIMTAGARSILMSLWSVDDDATQQLMCKFYSYLLDPEHPNSEVESLQKAQEYIRSQPQWKSPIYWAGWVIAGDGWQSIR